MDETPNRAAGGFLIALATIAGAGIGLMFGQSTIGLLAGLAVGIVAAVVVAVRDGRRRG